MRKADEVQLWGELKRRAAAAPDRYCHVRALARELGIPEGRAEYLTLKWAARGWYDYGVHCLAGWLTEAGWATDIDDRPKGAAPASGAGR